MMNPYSRRWPVCAMAVCVAWQAAHAQSSKPADGGAKSGAPAEIQRVVANEAVPSAAASTNELDNLVSQGMFFLASGRGEDAVALFKQVLQKDKSHRQALFGLGTSLVELRRYREAVIVFERMLSLYPDAFEAMNNLAWMYATANVPAYRDGKKAVEYAQQAVLLAPASFEIWNTLSEAYFVAGEYEKARRASAEAVRLSREKNASARVIKEYERQFDKCKRASEAMSLVE